MKAVIVDASRTLPDEWRRNGLGQSNGKVIDVPQAFLDERQAKGIDRFDEVWEGVLHMVPPPVSEHQHLVSKLLVLFDRVAEAGGLIVWAQAGFYRTPKDYRVPDLVVIRPEHQTKAGLSGAELVVEIRSPRDETDRKLDWYATRGVAEIVTVDPPTRAVELYLGRAGKAVLVPIGSGGAIDLATLDLRLAPVHAPAGHRLHVTGPTTDQLI